MPLGTEIINIETNKLICEVLKHNEKHLIAEEGKEVLEMPYSNHQRIKHQENQPLVRME